MRITLVAHTQTTEDFVRLAEEKQWEPTSASGAEQLIEFGGRACYQSWRKPNPATAETGAYIANVKLQRHFSVIEHSTVSFYLEGVSRSLTHELVRHRHFSFSQLSQRYVHPARQEPVIPPLFEKHDEAQDVIYKHFLSSVAAYNTLVEIGARDIGPQSRKQVREAARSVLPNCTPTDLLVSGNFRSWMEFVEKRDSPAADREIARAARFIRELLEGLAPAVFTPEPVTLVEQLAPAFDPPQIQPEYSNELEVGAP